TPGPRPCAWSTARSEPASWPGCSPARSATRRSPMRASCWANDRRWPPVALRVGRVGRSARRLARAAPHVARVDARTKNLLRRVQPGEVAVIDHEDIDRVAAEELVARGVSAVVNAA